MKKYNNYKEIPNQYKFDLEDLLQGKTIEELIEGLDQYTKVLVENKEKQYQSIEEFIAYKEKSKEFQIYFNKVYNYISNKRNTNLVDPETTKVFGIFMNKYQIFMKELGSEKNRFFKNIDKMQAWKNDPRVAIYKKEIDGIIDSFSHKLDDKIEDYLSEVSKGQIALQETFAILRDSETKFQKPRDSKGKEYTLNPSTYAKLMKNKDETLRKETYKNFFEGYLGHKETFSSLLEAHLRNKSTAAISRKFNSLTEAEIFSDKVSVELLETLFSSVQKYKGSYDKYQKLLKAFHTKKYNRKPKKWDLNLPLVKVKEDYSIEEAQELLYKAVEPLGTVYLNKVKEAIKQRWVDYLPVQNKRGGAYSIGGHFGIDKKYILMNFNGTLDAVSTLAHEMGHSMHSWYSDENQPFELAAYPIFLAEIASIFNELMLFDHMYKNSKKDTMKFYLLQESINDFMGTVVKQTQWANYEFELYKKIDAGIPVKSYKAFEDLYVETMKKYTNNPEKVKTGDPRNVYSVMVPHFYYNFYVYKYAIGFIVANVFFQKYKESGTEELQNYINKFLSAGSKDWPIQLLKDAGVDLNDSKIYEKAFAVLDEKIKLFEKIGKKIFK
ncbi:oligoendopeptidase F [Mycoplasma procyoni]|nr:oligoendopeptidase F [Mycoplasma procyoni]